MFGHSRFSRPNRRERGVGPLLFALLLGFGPMPRVMAHDAISTAPDFAVSAEATLVTKEQVLHLSAQTQRLDLQLAANTSDQAVEEPQETVRKARRRPFFSFNRLKRWAKRTASKIAKGLTWVGKRVDQLSNWGEEQFAKGGQAVGKATGYALGKTVELVDRRTGERIRDPLQHALGCAGELCGKQVFAKLRHVRQLQQARKNIERAKVMAEEAPARAKQLKRQMIGEVIGKAKARGREWAEKNKTYRRVNAKLKRVRGRVREMEQAYDELERIYREMKKAGEDVEEVYAKLRQLGRYLGKRRPPRKTIEEIEAEKLESRHERIAEIFAKIRAARKEESKEKPEDDVPEDEVAEGEGPGEETLVSRTPGSCGEGFDIRCEKEKSPFAGTKEQAGKALEAGAKDETLAKAPGGRQPGTLRQDTEVPEAEIGRPTEPETGPPEGEQVAGRDTSFDEFMEPDVQVKPRTDREKSPRVVTTKKEEPEKAAPAAPTPVPQPEPESKPEAKPITNFAGVWHSETSCREEDATSHWAYTWTIKLVQVGDAIKGVIFFHACPGGGRVIYEVSGKATTKNSVLLDGAVLPNTRAGGLGKNAKASRKFTIEKGKAPSPNPIK